MGELQEGGIGITYDSDDQDDVSEQEVLADVAEESELAPDSPEALRLMVLKLKAQTGLKKQLISSIASIEKSREPGKL